MHEITYYYCVLMRDVFGAHSTLRINYDNIAEAPCLLLS